MQSRTNNPGPLRDRLLTWPLYPLPHHGLSRLVHAAARGTAPAWKDFLLRQFLRRFVVNLGEAANPDPHAYPSFNAFFTRELAPDARPIDTDPSAIVSPVDGGVSQAGRIADGRIIQAKGRSYSALELLGGDRERAEPFRDGQFATLYLSPRDYHRVHMPVDGVLREMVYVPGRLFPVHATAVRTVPRVFARNERVAALFDTPAGPMAMVLVGALFVGSIETVWAGEITPGSRRQVTVTAYPPEDIRLARGAEMGRFNMGSTVILMFAGDAIRWRDALRADAPVRMGRAIADIAHAR